MKAQVLAGGRGKGHFDTDFQGGVHVADSKEQVVELSKQMIGHTLITKQTGAEGRPCNMVHIAETVDIAKEFYFAVLMDRASAGPMVVGSSEGGMNIEEVRAARAIGRCNTTHDAGVSPGLHWVHAHVYPVLLLCNYFLREGVIRSWAGLIMPQQHSICQICPLAGSYFYTPGSCI